MCIRDSVYQRRHPHQRLRLDEGTQGRVDRILVDALGGKCRRHDHRGQHCERSRHRELRRTHPLREPRKQAAQRTPKLLPARRGARTTRTCLLYTSALVRSHVPPLIEDRVLGPEFDRLTESFTAQVFSAESDIHADVTLDAG